MSAFDFCFARRADGGGSTGLGAADGGLVDGGWREARKEGAGVAWGRGEDARA